MELNPWSPRAYEQSHGVLPKESHPQRQYQDFVLDSDDLKSQRTINAFLKASKDLVASKDTGKGVHLQFGREAHYWTLVEVMDILSQEHFWPYSFYRKEIWVFNPIYHKVETDKIEVPLPCGGIVLTTNLEFEDAQKKARQKIKDEFMRESITTYFPSGLLYLALCVLAIIKVRALQ